MPGSSMRLLIFLVLPRFSRTGNLWPALGKGCRAAFRWQHKGPHDMPSSEGKPRNSSAILGYGLPHPNQVNERVGFPLLKSALKIFHTNRKGYPSSWADKRAHSRSECVIFPLMCSIVYKKRYYPTHRLKYNVSISCIWEYDTLLTAQKTMFQSLTNTGWNLEQNCQGCASPCLYLHVLNQDSLGTFTPEWWPFASFYQSLPILKKTKPKNQKTKPPPPPQTNQPVKRTLKHTKKHKHLKQAFLGKLFPLQSLGLWILGLSFHLLAASWHRQRGCPCVEMLHAQAVEVQHLLPRLHCPKQWQPEVLLLHAARQQQAAMPA